MDLRYGCLPQTRWPFSKEDGAFTLLCEADMEKIRLWRNAQIPILRQQEPLSTEQQAHYWQNTLIVECQQDKPPQILLALKEGEHLIGYGGLTHIDWHSLRAEISLLIMQEIKEESAHFLFLFREAIGVLEKIAFEQLHLERLVAEVYAFRHGVIATFKSGGFCEEGRLRSHVRKEGKSFDSILLGKVRVQKDQKALLLTSISKKTALITAIRDSMGALGEHFRLIGCDKDPHCLGKYSVDFFWNAPPWSDPNAAAILLSFCRQHNVVGLIPTRDSELEYFVQLQSQFAKEKIAIHCSSGSSITACQDKWMFMTECSKQAIAVIPSFLSCEELPIGEKRYVVKERFSFHPKQLSFCSSLHEVKEKAKKLKYPLFQPFIEGEEYSIDLYRSRKTKKACALVRKRDIVIDTEAYLTTPVVHKELERMALKAASHFDLTGHTMFQALETKNKELFFIECNPRIGGASTAAFANGLKSIEWFLEEEVLGRPASIVGTICTPLLPQLRIRADVVPISHTIDM